MSEQNVKPAFLLVDDDVNQLEVYVELMKSLGIWHLPILASRDTWLLDLRSAIQHYSINSVITDLNMPNFNGFDVFSLMVDSMVKTLPDSILWLSICLISLSADRFTYT